MRLLLLVALVLFVYAGCGALGFVVAVSLPHAVGLVALALAAWVASILAA